jgi:hypothetical protein
MNIIRRRLIPKKFFLGVALMNGFYLLHMEYERSIGLVMGKSKKFIADFHVKVLLMAKNMI